MSQPTAIQLAEALQEVGRCEGTGADGSLGCTRCYESAKALLATFDPEEARLRDAVVEAAVIEVKRRTEINRWVYEGEVNRAVAALEIHIASKEKHDG